MADTINITRRTALKAMPFAGSAIAAPVTVCAAPVADQAVLNLGARFDTAFAIEEDLRLAANSSDSDDAWEAWEAASAATQEVVDEIERMPATSLEALKLKARCILWSSGDGTVTVCRGNTSDDRFARQIIMSLLAA